MFSPAQAADKLPFPMPFPEGLCPVPGSTNAAHIQENISIFDFALTDEEMSAIRAIDRGEPGRSFNIGYGDWGFGNFQDYTYNHSYTPAF